MTPAEVFRIFESFGVVRSDIQDDRQCSCRMDATDQGVQRELPDRDAESARALIADAQDALTVGHDDDIDVFIRTISQQRGDRVTERIGNKQSARPSINVAELLARQRNGGRVNNRRHFRNVVEKKPVKEDLVGVLQSPQVDVPFEVVVFSLVGLVSAHDLLLKRLDLRRKKTVQAKLDALVSLNAVPLFSNGLSRRSIREAYPRDLIEVSSLSWPLCLFLSYLKSSEDSVHHEQAETFGLL